MPAPLRLHPFRMQDDFRTQHSEMLERVLTGSIAALLEQGLITLQTVAQDGMRFLKLHFLIKGRRPPQPLPVA
jgi:hypothetical protein